MATSKKTQGTIQEHGTDENGNPYWSTRLIDDTAETLITLIPGAIEIMIKIDGIEQRWNGKDKSLVDWLTDVSS